MPYGFDPIETVEFTPPNAIGSTFEFRVGEPELEIGGDMVVRWGFTRLEGDARIQNGVRLEVNGETVDDQPGGTVPSFNRSGRLTASGVGDGDILTVIFYDPQLGQTYATVELEVEGGGERFDPAAVYITDCEVEPEEVKVGETFTVGAQVQNDNPQTAEIEIGVYGDGLIDTIYGVIPAEGGSWRASNIEADVPGETDIRVEMVSAEMGG